MKLRDLVSRVTIDLRKFTDYALDPEHPVGRHKARVFKAALGYTRENYQALLEQIEAQVMDAEAILQRTDVHGQHVQVDLQIVGVAGQRAVVRTAWLIASGADEAHLVTLYVRTEEK